MIANRPRFEEWRRDQKIQVSVLIKVNGTVCYIDTGGSIDDAQDGMITKAPKAMEDELKAQYHKEIREADWE